MELHDNQIKQTTFFRQKTCKTVKIDQNTRD